MPKPVRRTDSPWRSAVTVRRLLAARQSGTAYERFDSVSLTCFRSGRQMALFSAQELCFAEGWTYRNLSLQRFNDRTACNAPDASTLSATTRAQNLPNPNCATTSAVGLVARRLNTNRSNSMNVTVLSAGDNVPIEIHDSASGCIKVAFRRSNSEFAELLRGMTRNSRPISGVECARQYARWRNDYERRRPLASDEQCEHLVNTVLGVLLELCDGMNWTESAERAELICNVRTLSECLNRIMAVKHHQLKNAFVTRTALRDYIVGGFLFPTQPRSAKPDNGTVVSMLPEWVQLVSERINTPGYKIAALTLEFVCRRIPAQHGVAGYAVFGGPYEAFYLPSHSGVAPRVDYNGDDCTGTEFDPVASVVVFEHSKGGFKVLTGERRCETNHIDKYMSDGRVIFKDGRAYAIETYCDEGRCWFTLGEPK